MASYRIRQYRDQDYEAVRTLFTRGILEHAPSVYRNALRSAWAQLGLLVVFLGVRVTVGYWLLGLVALALGLVAIWLLVRNFCTAYVEQALSTDLQDIPAGYLRAPDSGFWVAEAGGTVVGTVAVGQPEDPSERGVALELRRMSVSRDWRGRGVSKALCGEVLRFARARGFGTVVLTTSVVQVVAQRLYEGQGFRKVATFSPSLLATFLGFQLFHYRCDLPGRSAPTAR